MRVLIACEESQAVCIEFRKLGHEAYSCDLQPCSGGHPEWHLQMDVFEAIELKDWDMGIFFPDCTYLTVTANKWLKDQPPRKSGALVGEARRKARSEAISFFMKIANCKIPKIAIENPVGCMSSEWRKPDQIIQPYYFGDSFQKSTCLWLKNLPLLKHYEKDTLFHKKTHVYPGEMMVMKSGNVMPKWYAEKSSAKSEANRRSRSKTFQGIAKALATQYGNIT